MDSLLVTLLGAGAGGSIITVLGILTSASLKVQRQQGEQIAEWRAIVDEKDRQIIRLETMILDKDKKITELETRVGKLERQIRHGSDR
jgi:uncharacterized protein (DUF3084 family)